MWEQGTANFRKACFPGLWVEAYAYAPGRLLLRLEAGQKLRDASVIGVGPTGVAFTTDEGRVFNAPLP